MKYYAVIKGRTTGIFKTWEECNKSVSGFKGAEFKSFSNFEDANKYLQQGIKKHKKSNITKTKQDFDIFRGDEQELIEKRKKQNDTTKYVVVYTDGSCLNNGKGGASGGIGVFFGDNDNRNVSMKLMDEMKPTNQRAEILAVISALEIVKDEPVEIRTDSMYVIKAVTDWSIDWERRDWKTSKNEPVQNLDLFKKLFNLIEQRKEKVRWTYVPGHEGYYGNEKANELAIQAASK